MELVGHRTTGNGIIFGDYNPNASVPQLASGDNSMSFGAANQATADYAVGIGNANTVSEMYSFGVGYSNTVAALSACAIGQSNNVGTSASWSMVMCQILSSLLLIIITICIAVYIINIK